MSQFKVPQLEAFHNQDTAKEHPVLYPYPPQWNHQKNISSIPYMFGIAMITLFTGYGVLMMGWLLVRAFLLITH